MISANALVLTFGICAWGGARASVIEKPAGALPIQHVPHSEVKSVPIETSKSKLLPLIPKFKIASGSSTRERLPKNLSSSTKQAAPTKRVASSDGLSKKTLAEVGVAGDEWDSAAKKFDQYDPSVNVSNGVRVEDIIEPSSEYQYSSGRKKNPFVPDIKVARRATVQKELSPNDVEIPIINPLQSFPVNQLGVIGVWEGDDHVWKALIETPTNQGIETKLGDPAGNSGGRIMSITPESVVVREFSVRTDGTREYRDVPLYMGGDNPQRSNGPIGGRLILRPGASAPEIESADETSKIISTPPPAVVSKSPGTLSTIEKQTVEKPTVEEQTVERQADANSDQSAKPMLKQNESKASGASPAAFQQPVTNPSSSLPGGAL
jgi:Tfp pilus assembly protein PilP